MEDIKVGGFILRSFNHTFAVNPCSCMLCQGHIFANDKVLCDHKIGFGDRIICESCANRYGVSILDTRGRP